MPVGRAGLSPVMVGRAAELDRLRRLHPHPGDPEVALVSGEAGIGKTRLVREMLAGLPAGTPVLSGHALEGATGRPFDVFLEAVEPRVRDWTEIPTTLESRADPLRVLVGPVAPSLATGPDRDYGPDELLRAGVELVRYLVGSTPAVLLFEDLHWADPDSVALFGRLATADDLPILLVGTYRPEDLGRRDPMAQLLLSLERQRTVTQIAVDRLDRPAVRDMVSAVFERPAPWASVDLLYERTGGNPFFLEELLDTACCVDPESLASVPLPWNLSEAVLRHLDGLPGEVRRIVDAAAVLGQQISFDLLAAVTGAGEDDLIDALRVLVERNLLVETEPDVFAFRHALTREAVEGQLLGRERRRMHEKALAVLLEQGSTDYADLAHHANAAARFDEALEFARRGARQFLRSGSTWQALRLADLGLMEAPDDGELLALARQAAWLLGMTDAAVDYAQRALELAMRDGQREGEAEALGYLARMRWDLGDIEGMNAVVERAIDLVQELPPSPELVAMETLVAEACMLAGHSDDAITWADRALAAVGDAGAESLRPRALVAKGTALLSDPLQVDEGLAILDQAEREAEAAGDGLSLARAMHNAVFPRTLDTPVPEIWTVVGRIRSVSEQVGFNRCGAAVIAVRVATADGDRASAESYLAEAQRKTPWTTSGVDATWWAYWDAVLALESGDADLARPSLAQAAPPAGAEHEDFLDYLELLIEAAALASDRAEAASLLDTYGTVRAGRAFTIDNAPSVVQSVLRAGVPVEDVRRSIAGWFPGMLATRYTAHVDAILAEAEGEHEVALAAYLQAVRPAVGLDPAWVRADVHQGAARSLLALGRPDEARVHAEQAVEVLANWPGWRQREAAALVRRLDPRSAPVGGGPETLTPREREVVALLAEGLSNAEVARRLYISTKTAAVHVSNILAKLGMSSRTEVAAWAVREGVTSA